MQEVIVLLKLLVFVLLVMDSTSARLLQNGEAETCEFHFGGPLSVNRLKGTITNEKYFLDRPSCHLIFSNLPRGKLHLSFFNGMSRNETNVTTLQGQQRGNTSRCSQSYVKIFSVNDIGYEQEVAHLCAQQSEENDRKFVITYKHRIELVLVQWKHNITYHFKSDRIDLKKLYERRWVSEQGSKLSNEEHKQKSDDDNKHTSSSERQSQTEKQYVEAEECKWQQMFVCEHSVVIEDTRASSVSAAVSSDYAVLDSSNHTKKQFLCISFALVCNGESDCLPGDNSDEAQCSSKVFSAVGLAILAMIMLFVVVSVCFAHRKLRSARAKDNSRHDVEERCGDDSPVTVIDRVTVVSQQKMIVAGDDDDETSTTLIRKAVSFDEVKMKAQVGLRNVVSDKDICAQESSSSSHVWTTTCVKLLHDPEKDQQEKGTKN